MRFTATILAGLAMIARYVKAERTPPWEAGAHPHNWDGTGLAGWLAGWFVGGRGLSMGRRPGPPPGLACHTGGLGRKGRPRSTDRLIDSSIGPSPPPPPPGWPGGHSPRVCTGISLPTHPTHLATHIPIPTCTAQTLRLTKHPSLVNHTIPTYYIHSVAAQPCATVNNTIVDPFTAKTTFKMARRGNKVKLTFKIGNTALFDITNATLTVPLPAGVSYANEWKANALPDSLNGPKGTKRVNPVVSGQNIIWNPFVVAANQTRPRTLYVWTRIGSAAVSPLNFIATYTDNVPNTPACTVTSTTATVRTHPQIEYRGGGWARRGFGSTKLLYAICSFHFFARHSFRSRSSKRGARRGAGRAVVGVSAGWA